MFIRLTRWLCVLLLAFMVLGFSLGVVRIDSTNAFLNRAGQYSGYAYRIIPPQSEAANWLTTIGDWLGASDPLIGQDQSHGQP